MVVAIMGIIAIFVVPAATTMVMGTELTRASQQFSDLLANARQTAITKNQRVEVRLIRFADPEQPGERVDDPGTWKYRAVQLMEVLPNGAEVAATKLVRLTGSVLMNDDQYSSLLSGTAESDSGQKALPVNTATATDPALPRVADRDARLYQYVGFRFLTDGSTDLPGTGKWYVTLLAQKEQQKLSHPASRSGGSDPIFALNYCTLQVDPVSGSARVYRPVLAAK